jgi:hypothetical protein
MSDGQVQVTPVPAAVSGGYSPLPYSYNQQPTLDTAMLAIVTSIVGLPALEIPGADIPAFPRVSAQVTGVTSHGPYMGPPPTTTGAISNSPISTVAPTVALPPNPNKLKYNPNGELNAQQPFPYTPAGRLRTNGTKPIYRVQSDFGYQSILLGLYQEWIELDLFHKHSADFLKGAVSCRRPYGK